MSFPNPPQPVDLDDWFKTAFGCLGKSLETSLQGLEVTSCEAPRPLTVSERVYELVFGLASFITGDENEAIAIAEGIIEPVNVALDLERDEIAAFLKAAGQGMLAETILDRKGS